MPSSRMPPLDVRYVAAPMVNQSDLPFRILVQNHGATLAYSQMLQPSRLELDPEYLAFHRRDFSLSPYPVVAQLCGNDADEILRGARKVVDVCDGIDLNLGCPQDHARDGHYGAYLLSKNDWPLVEGIVSSLARSVSVPVSVKMRLCPQGQDATLALARRLSEAGASFVALHARNVSARRRRQGPANLDAVKALVKGLDVPVISNGNVRTWTDIQANEAYTSASGIMVGEALLGNPCVFENGLPDPISISLEYLNLCRLYPDTASHLTIQAHVRRFFGHQCDRQPWFSQLRRELDRCPTVEHIESLLLDRARKWLDGTKTSPSVERDVYADDLDLDIAFDC